MARRKKLESAVYYAPGEEKLSIFGWCNDGHHRTCVLAFPGHRCNCTCHEEESQPDERDRAISDE
jgi:hypothetical protein